MGLQDQNRDLRNRLASSQENLSIVGRKVLALSFATQELIFEAHPELAEEWAEILTRARETAAKVPITYSLEDSDGPHIE